MHTPQGDDCCILSQLNMDVLSLAGLEAVLILGGRGNPICANTRSQILQRRGMKQALWAGVRGWLRLCGCLLNSDADPTKLVLLLRLCCQHAAAPLPPRLKMR